MAFLSVIYIGLLSVVSTLAIDCNWVGGLDCTTYPVEQECGTDRVTYTNRCFFAKAVCVNSNLHMQAIGACAGGPASTASPVTGGTTKAMPTAAPGPIFSGHNAVLDFFCRELEHEDCPKDTGPVCASDGNPYANYCEFEKQRCTHRHLEVKSFGAC